jgi:hypothetical protein
MYATNRSQACAPALTTANRQQGKSEQLKTRQKHMALKLKNLSRIQMSRT